MKSLENYSKLIIRISRVRIFSRNSNNGHRYQYLVKCDELPGCCGHGSTISDALDDFQNMAKLWLNWFGSLSPQNRKV